MVYYSSLKVMDAIIQPMWISSGVDIYNFEINQTWEGVV